MGREIRTPKFLQASPSIMGPLGRHRVPRQGGLAGRAAVAKNLAEVRTRVAGLEFQTLASGSEGFRDKTG